MVAWLEYIAHRHFWTAVALALLAIVIIVVSQMVRRRFRRDDEHESSVDSSHSGMGRGRDLEPLDPHDTPPD
jgi:hypothetical protein